MNRYSWHTTKQKRPGGWYECDAIIVFPTNTVKFDSYPFYKPNRKGNPKAPRNKLLNSKMRSIYGRKWPKIKKLLKNMTVVRLKDFNDIKDRRFLEFPMTHSAIVELAPGEI